MTETTKPPVVIVDFQAENYQRIKAIRIQPGADVSVVPITGRNEQGKSSLLDAIAATLGGKSYLPDMPVRAGEDGAATRMVLSNGLIITRQWDADGSDKFVVENGDGMRAGSPQAVLNKLFSGVTFDPIGFMREKPEDQLAIIRRMVTLDVDVDEAARLNKADYDARRDVNRDLKQADTVLGQMPTFTGLPAEPVDEAALEGVIATAAETNSGIERRRMNREQHAADMKTNAARIVVMDEQIAALQVERADFAQKLAEQAQQLEQAPPLPDLVDVTEAQEKLRQARETNRRIEATKSKAGQRRIVEGLKLKSEGLTTAIDERDAAVAKAFETAQMPVSGLTFGDGRLMLDGVPLSQASTARKLRVSTAIGMAMSPDLRVMLVRDASLLDDDGYALLCAMAEESGYQFWVESVARPDSVGIIIEDGEIVGEPAPEPIKRGTKRVKKQPGAIAVIEGATSPLAVMTAQEDALGLPDITPEKAAKIIDEVRQADPPFVADEPAPSAPRAGLFDYD